MRKLILILLLMGHSIAQAQDSLVVEEIKEDISRGFKPGYMIVIPKSNAKDLSSNWKKQLKTDSKRDVIDKKSELVLPLGVLSAISSDSIVIYSRITASKSEKTSTELKVFVMASDSTFISAKVAPSIDDRIKDYVRAFGVSQYRNAVVNELNFEQKKNNQMKEELRRMEHENENTKKKIASNNYDNEKLREKIAANDEDLDVKFEEITQLTKEIPEHLEPEQKSDDQKQLNKLKKEHDKINDEKSSFLKKIEKNNSENEDLQKKFDLNLSTNIPNKKLEIEKQEEVVKNLSHQLNNIR
jgi:hypothetical protein